MTEEQLDQEVLQWFTETGYTHNSGYVETAPDSCERCEVLP